MTFYILFRTKSIPSEEPVTVIVGIFDENTIEAVYANYRNKYGKNNVWYEDYNVNEERDEWYHGL